MKVKFWACLLLSYRYEQWRQIEFRHRYSSSSRESFEHVRENKRIKFSFRKLKRNQEGEEVRQKDLLGHAVVKDKSVSVWGSVWGRVVLRLCPVQDVWLWNGESNTDVFLCEIFFYRKVAFIFLLKSSHLVVHTVFLAKWNRLWVQYIGWSMPTAFTVVWQRRFWQTRNVFPTIWSWNFVFWNISLLGMQVLD